MPTPRRIIITSFVVNAIQRRDELVASITDITYSDPLEAAASRLEITFGVTQPIANLNINNFIEVKFKYSTDAQEFNTGTHKIDSVERGMNPGTWMIGAIAYDFQLGLASIKSWKYTNSTLSSIVNNIAGQTTPVLTVQGDPDSSLLVGTSQSNVVGSAVVEEERTALALLKKLAQKYGYAFNLKYGQLRFESFELLSARAAVANYTNTDLNKGTKYQASALGTLRTALAYYQDPTPLTYISYIDNGAYKQDSVSFDNEGYYRTQAAALLRSKGGLREANLRQDGGKLELEGETFLYAGRRIQLLNGSNFVSYLIDRAYHRLNKDGWRCSLDVFLLR